MAPSKKVKKGRPRLPYVTTWGEHINGLRRRASDGRWVIVETGGMFTEPDERRAIAYFRHWETKQGKQTIRMPVLGPFASLSEFERAMNAPGAELTLTTGQTPHPVATLEHTAPEEAVWAWLREQLIENPKRIAQMTGIPEAAYLADLPKPKPSPTLSEVGELYFTKNKITDHELGKSRLFWGEFVDAVGVATLRELTPQLLSGYYDAVGAAIAKEGRSPTYARHRFGKIKSILSFARRRGLNPDDVRRALDCCAVLVPPKASALDPHPISREDFAKLFAAADVQMKAVLLLALNACMYGDEVAQVRWNHLDLDKRTLLTDRGKTGVVRVAVLWERTIDALARLPRIKTSDALFIAAQGLPHNANTFRKIFSGLRDPAKVSSDVKFADVRDGAYTAAVSGKSVQFEHVRILGGHRTGMSDHYLKRNPGIVADACEAIETEYFSTRSTKSEESNLDMNSRPIENRLDVIEFIEVAEALKIQPARMIDEIRR